MIQAITNSYSQDEKYYQLKLQNKAEASSSIDESSAESKQNITLPQAVTLKTDTVEISDSGRNALAISREMPSSTPEASKTEQSSNSATANSSVSAAAKQMAAKTSSADTSSSTDLTSLTESEIQRLVSEGTITKAEADAELVKRQQKSQPAKENVQAVNAYQKMAQKDPLEMNQTGSLMDTVA